LPQNQWPYRRTSQAANCASPAGEALLELWLTGLKEFENDFRALPVESLATPLDGDRSTALSIGAHVLESARSDVKWCMELSGRTQTSLKVAPELSTLAELLAEAERLLAIVPGVLATLTTEDIYKQCDAGLTIEIILEHSIVHFKRHRRQLDLRLRNN
jgi:hypothetical protein